jgi:hypothetical protein
MLCHPLRVLALAADWSSIVHTVLWIDAHGDPPVYLRQVDVPGVDTKFIERHRSVLADLLDCQLDPTRIDATRPRSDFLKRYGSAPSRRTYASAPSTRPARSPVATAR